MRFIMEQQSFPVKHLPRPTFVDHNNVDGPFLVWLFLYLILLFHWDAIMICLFLSYIGLILIIVLYWSLFYIGHCRISFWFCDFEFSFGSVVHFLSSPQKWYSSLLGDMLLYIVNATALLTVSTSISNSLSQSKEKHQQVIIYFQLS